MLARSGGKSFCTAPITYRSLSHSGAFFSTPFHRADRPRQAAEETLCRCFQGRLSEEPITDATPNFLSDFG
ncbi:hypothetical protein [Burkholderia lata]|uniref:hypothetical protein n=1 Tax=Burkholderia lata (strain ATCC 17760 / DSM 23089 / LMG 22485 / NCIMB 9086 / R18194 / 383) TaxID=482957 RepID=UPI003999D348